MVTEPASPLSLWQKMWLCPWAAHLYRCGCPSRLPSQGAAPATPGRRGSHTAAAGQGLLPRNTGRSDHFMLGTPSSTHGDRREIRSRSPPPGDMGKLLGLWWGWRVLGCCRSVGKGQLSLPSHVRDGRKAAMVELGWHGGGGMEEPSTSGGQVGGSIPCRVGRDRGGEQARDPAILDTVNWKGTESERSVGAGQ